MPLSKDGNAEMHVLPVPLTLLSAISTLRVSLPTDLRQPEPRRSTLLTLKVGYPPHPLPCCHVNIACAQVTVMVITHGLLVYSSQCQLSCCSKALMLLWLLTYAGERQELEKRYEHGLPRLDPCEDMNIADAAVSSAVRRIEQLEQQLSTNEVFKVCGLQHMWLFHGSVCILDEPRHW